MRTCLTNTCPNYRKNNLHPIKTRCPLCAQLTECIKDENQKVNIQLKKPIEDKNQNTNIHLPAIGYIFCFILLYSLVMSFITTGLTSVFLPKNNAGSAPETREKIRREEEDWITRNVVISISPKSTSIEKSEFLKSNLVTQSKIIVGEEYELQIIIKAEFKSILESYRGYHYSRTILVSPILKASIQNSGLDLIPQNSTVEQYISGKNDTRWIWAVKAKQAGIYPLNIFVSRRVENDVRREVYWNDERVRVVSLIAVQESASQSEDVKNNVVNAQPKSDETSKPKSEQKGSEPNIQIFQSKSVIIIFTIFGIVIFFAKKFKFNVKNISVQIIDRNLATIETPQDHLVNIHQTNQRPNQMPEQPTTISISGGTFNGPVNLASNQGTQPTTIIDTQNNNYFNTDEALQHQIVELQQLITELEAQHPNLQTEVQATQIVQQTMDQIQTQNPDRWQKLRDQMTILKQQFFNPDRHTQALKATIVEVTKTKWEESLLVKAIVTYLDKFSETPNKGA